jgi:uncharacterized protein YlxP (DUF503 family)
VVVGICRVELHLPGNTSLKGKRSRLKPLLNRLRRGHNLATAEVDLNDSWQSAVIAMATIANEPGRVHAALERAVQRIESYCPDVQVVDWQIEVL